MKINILLIYLLTINLYSQAQQYNNTDDKLEKLDSISIVNSYAVYKYQYDNEKRPANRTLYNYNNPSAGINYSYNSDGLITQRIEYNGGLYAGYEEYTFRMDYTYDNDGNLIDLIEYNYSDEWIPLCRTFKSWSINQCFSSLTDWKDENWFNDERDSVIYYFKNNRIDSLVNLWTYNYENKLWVNKFKTIYNYDDENRTGVYKMYGGSYSFNWGLVSENSFTYDTNLFVTSEYMYTYGHDNQVIPISKSLSELDSLGNVLYRVDSTYDRNTKTWDFERSVKCVYDYSVSLNKVSYVLEEYTPLIAKDPRILRYCGIDHYYNFNNEYFNNSFKSKIVEMTAVQYDTVQYHFYYSNFDSPNLVQEAREEQPFTFYPNPVKDKLLIEIKNSNIPNYIYLYNNSGSLVYSNMVNYDLTIDFTEMPKGLYILSIVNNNVVYSKKVIHD